MRCFRACSLILLLAGCGEDKTPPHWANVCTQSITVTQAVPVIAMNGQVSIAIVSHRECVETQRKCVWGKDYRGEKACAP